MSLSGQIEQAHACAIKIKYSRNYSFESELLPSRHFAFRKSLKLVSMWVLEVAETVFCKFIQGNYCNSYRLITYRLIIIGSHLANFGPLSR